MKLSEKQLKKMDERCIKNFGCNFDTMYNFIKEVMDKNEQEKILKKQNKSK